jgi:eukaryotic-like serine/threonine-protein kinase
MTEREVGASVVLHPAGETIGFGPFRFDRANRILSRDGQELPLPPRVLGILEHLVARPGSVVSKQALIDAVWNGAYVTDTSLTEAVSQLRQALGDDPQQPTYIQTVHRRGYRFVALVTPSGAAGGPLRLAGKPATAVVPDAPVAVPEREPRAKRPVSRAMVLVLFAVGVAAVALIAQLRSVRVTSMPLIRATIPISLGDANTLRYPPVLTLTPDGSAIVYAVSHGGRSQLFLRPLDRFESVPLAGTEGGVQPFVSPDARWVGFFADGKLKKVPLAGGPVVTICEAPIPSGGSWGDDGTIVFTIGEKSGLFRVSANGGSPQALAVPDARAAELAYEWPEVLPGSGAALFTIWPSGGLEESRIGIVPLRGKPASPRVLVKGGSYARYAPTGHIVFARKSRLMALAFDARRAETRGEPVALFDGVAVDWFTGAAQLALSRTGTLAYVPGTHEVPAHSLVLLDREGNARPLTTATRPFMNVDAARDGRRLAVTIHEGRGSDMWLVDTNRGALTRLTFEAHNIEPVFSPDGKRVAFASSRSGPVNIFWVGAEGTQPAERLLESARNQYPDSWSPDGRTLVFVELTPQTGSDLWILPLDTRAPRPFVQTPFNEEGSAFSPDGRFLAYDSNETNKEEVFVRPFPEGSPKWQVSSSGGYGPTWSPDGRELFYRDDDGVWVVPIRTAPSFEAGPARRLFADRRLIAMTADRAGRGLIAVRRNDEAPATELNLVLGWFAELQRLTGAGSRSQVFE